MALEVYRKKRRFGVTSEPKGKAPRRRVKTLAHVVQKHRATALHYDFRLEWNGVMLSWAVPKGPASFPPEGVDLGTVERDLLEKASISTFPPSASFAHTASRRWRASFSRDGSRRRSPAARPAHKEERNDDHSRFFLG